jgi:hypothetical protein
MAREKSRRDGHLVKRLNSSRPLAACLALTLAGGAWLFAAGPPKPHAKVDKAVARLTADAGEIRVIVTATKGHKKDLAQNLARKQHRVIADHESIDALSVALPAQALEDLIADPAVSHVSIDANVHSFLDEVGTLDSNMLLPTLALPHQGFTGNGVGVAVLDTGIVSHS